jgi:hypothetical protein
MPIFLEQQHFLKDKASEPLTIPMAHLTTDAHHTASGNVRPTAYRQPMRDA